MIVSRLLLFDLNLFNTKSLIVIITGILFKANILYSGHNWHIILYLIQYWFWAVLTQRPNGMFFVLIIDLYLTQ